MSSGAADTRDVTQNAKAFMGECPRKDQQNLENISFSSQMLNDTGQIWRWTDKSFLYCCIKFLDCKRLYTPSWSVNVSTLNVSTRTCTLPTQLNEVKSTHIFQKTSVSPETSSKKKIYSLLPIGILVFVSTAWSSLEKARYGNGTGDSKRIIYAQLARWTILLIANFYAKTVLLLSNTLLLLVLAEHNNYFSKWTRLFTEL